MARCDDTPWEQAFVQCAKALAAAAESKENAAKMREPNVLTMLTTAMQCEAARLDVVKAIGAIATPCGCMEDGIKVARKVFIKQGVLKTYMDVARRPLKDEVFQSAVTRTLCFLCDGGYVWEVAEGKRATQLVIKYGGWLWLYNALVRARYNLLLHTLNNGQYVFDVLRLLCHFTILRAPHTVGAAKYFADMGVLDILQYFLQDGVCVTDSAKKVAMYAIRNVATDPSVVPFVTEPLIQLLVTKVYGKVDYGGRSDCATAAGILQKLALSEESRMAMLYRCKMIKSFVWVISQASSVASRRERVYRLAAHALCKVAQREDAHEFVRADGGIVKLARLLFGRFKDDETEDDKELSRKLSEEADLALCSLVQYDFDCVVEALALLVSRIEDKDPSCDIKRWIDDLDVRFPGCKICKTVCSMVKQRLLEAIAGEDQTTLKSEMKYAKLFAPQSAKVELARADARHDELEKKAALVARREALGVAHLDYPNEFLCPITHCKMADPVVASDGHSYERAAILDVFSKGNGLSPLTREKLNKAVLVANRTLKSRIERHDEDELSAVEAGRDAERKRRGESSSDAPPAKAPRSLSKVPAPELARESVQSDFSDDDLDYEEHFPTVSGFDRHDDRDLAAESWSDWSDAEDQ